MFYTSLVTHPRDLFDEGLDDALDLIQGRIGVSGIAVRVTGPPLLGLRMRPVEPRCFRTDGGLYFRSDTAHYGASRCMPPVADWVKSGNPLARIKAACEKRSLGCRAVVSVSRLGRFAERQPGFACKNAHAMPSRESLCLLNPDVQAWLGGLLADLSSNYDLDAIVLRDFHVDWGESRVVTMAREGTQEPWLRRLLAICVCESCQQGAVKAGIDPAAVQQTICGHVDNILRGDTPVDPDEHGAPCWSTELDEYLAWQNDALRDLLQILASAGTCDVLLSVGCDDGVTGGRAGASPDGLAGVIVPEALAEDPVAGGSGQTARREVGVELTPAVLHEGSPFVQKLLALAEQGYCGAELNHFGAIPPTGESVVRQAIRIVRRTPVG